MPRQLDPERDERIATLTRQGMSAPQIAVRVGVTPRTVQRARARTGTARPYGHRMTPEQITRAGELLADGCSFKEVGDSLGFCGWTIARHFPGRGWTESQAGKFAADIRRMTTR